MLDTGQVADLLRDAIGVVLRISTPMLLLSMIVGVLVAIFQAVTQIHEQTIGFILKVVIIVGVLLLSGGWMLTTLQEYTREIFDLMTRI